MLRKLLPIGTLLLFVVALMVVPQADASADPWKDEAHQYERRAPRGYYGWVPPGHLPPPHQRGWIPPGHRKDNDRYRGRDCERYDNDRYRDNRDMDTRDYRDYRYEPRKYKQYDQDNQDYGLIIRKGPRGTTVDVDYRNRDR